MSARAVIVIDLQNEYTATGKLPLTGIEAAVANAARVIDDARAKGIAVIHVRHEFAHGEKPAFTPGTNGVLIQPEVAPREGEPVVVKNHVNAFRETPLQRLLDEQNVRELDVVGDMTHKCIDAAERSAADLGYRVTVLHDACATGVQARVEELLSEVPRMIDAHSPDGFTPLALACFFGHVELARWLINRGANLDLPADNPMKVAPLHAASASRHLEIVRALLEGGANPNARQQGGFTPLHAAAQNGDAEIARVLIEKGADREARAENNQTALDFALLRGHAAVAAVIEG